MFAAMGVKNDVADVLPPQRFESCGAMERVVMLLNLANDPIIERIITPALRADRGGVSGL